MPKKQSPVVSDDGRRVQKPNQDIGYRVKAGQITLLSRKLVNVLLYHALRLKGSEDEAGLFWIDAPLLIKDIRFNSNNRQVLIDSLDEIQSVRVIRVLKQKSKNGAKDATDEDQTTTYISEVLMPSFAIRNTGHSGNLYLDARKDQELFREVRNKPGGVLQVGFALPKSIKDMLGEKDTFTPLPLGFMAALQTTGGLALYEVAKRFETSPGRRTNKESWVWWWHVLTGAADNAEPPEYKYFKRDVIKPAIDEINALTDILVELSEGKEGRRVSTLQFLITTKAQSEMDLDPRPVDVDLLARFNAIGVSTADAESYLRKYSPDIVTATLELVESRIADTSLKPVGSPSAYLKTAFDKNYAAGAAEKKKVIADKRKVSDKVQEQIKAQKPPQMLDRPLPVGDELVNSWRLFRVSPSAKLFKALPETFDLANDRQKKSFAAWISSQQ